MPFFRSDLESLQFQLTCEIPRIKVRAQYRSTGVLILVKASGAGEYWGEYGEYKYGHLTAHKTFCKYRNNNKKTEKTCWKTLYKTCYFKSFYRNCIVQVFVWYFYSIILLFFFFLWCNFFFIIKRALKLKYTSRLCLMRGRMAELTLRPIKWKWISMSRTYRWVSII